MQAPTPRDQAEGHPGRPGQEVPGGAGGRPRNAFQLKLYRDLKLQQQLHRGRRGRRLRHAGRALPHPEQGGEPRLDACRTATGRAAWPARVVPGGTAENPLKARWLGIYDGAGIHGTDDDRLARQRRLARLHPHGDPGRDRALRPGTGRTLRSTSPRGPISATGTSSQPRSSREAWRPVWRMHSVPMKTPRSRLRRTAYHMVEASLGPWITCHGRTGLYVSSTRPASVELSAGRDPSVLSVDAEDTQRPRP